MNIVHRVVMTLTNIDKLGRKFSGTTLQLGTDPVPGTYCHISLFVAFTKQMADKIHEANDFKSYTHFIICLYGNYHVSLPNVLSVFTIEVKFTYVVHQESNDSGVIFFYLTFTYKSTLSPSK